MITQEQKRRFAELRAGGTSLRKIAEELKISRPTLAGLEKESSAMVKNIQVLAQDELVCTFLLARNHRLALLGQSLKKINTALETKDFSILGPGELFGLQAKQLDLLAKMLDKSELMLTTDEVEPDAPVPPNPVEKPQTGPASPLSGDEIF